MYWIQILLHVFSYHIILRKRYYKTNRLLLLDMYSGQVSHYEINKLLLKVSAIVAASTVAALYNNTNTFNLLHL